MATRKSYRFINLGETVGRSSPAGMASGVRASRKPVLITQESAYISAARNGFCNKMMRLGESRHYRQNESEISRIRKREQVG